MTSLSYIKAVPLNDSGKIVYACQFTEDKFHFEEAPISNAAKAFFLELAGTILVFTPDSWLVWFPESIEFTDMTDEEFRAKYVPYDELPANIREKADRHPSYEKWCAEINMSYVER